MLLLCVPMAGATWWRWTPRVRMSNDPFPLVPTQHHSTRESTIWSLGGFTK